MVGKAARMAAEMMLEDDGLQKMIHVTVKGAADIGKLMYDGREQAIALPPGSTLHDLLEVLAGKYGEVFVRRIYQAGNKELRKDLWLLVNGRDIVFLNGLKTGLHDEDRISLLPLLAGG